MRALARLMAVDFRERQSRGDLAGAWDDVHVLLRMAEQVAASAPIIQMLVAAAIHHQAVHLGLIWVGDPRQTAGLLQAALADLRSLPPLPAPGEALKSEYLLLRNTLGLPPDERDDQLMLAVGNPQLDPLGRFALR